MIRTGTDTYHRITSVTARNSVSIARTTGDPVITADNYAFITAPSVANILLRVLIMELSRLILPMDMD